MSSTTYKTLIMQENYDHNNTPFTPLITQIDRITGCLTIITEQIIDELEGLEVLSPSNLIQVFDEADLIGSDNKYFVLYGMGQIKFSSNLVGTEILIKFGGKGSLFLDASRVATVIDSNGNVVETLHDVITEARTALELIKTANDLVALDTIIKSDITNAQNICGELENDTVVAEAKKVELNTVVASGETVKNNLNTSIATSSIVKTGLDNSVITANTAKTNLETATSTANISKTSIDESISTANISKTSIDESISISNTAITNMNTAITNMNTAIANGDLDNKVDKISGKGLSTNDFTNAYKNEVDKVANKQGKTDSSLNTTKKTIVGAINEVKGYTDTVDYSESVIIYSNLMFVPNTRKSFIKNSKNLVVVNFSISNTTSNNGITDQAIATIPSNIRPSVLVYTSAMATRLGTEEEHSPVLLTIKPNGEISVYLKGSKYLAYYRIDCSIAYYI